VGSSEAIAVQRAIRTTGGTRDGRPHTMLREADH